MMINRTMRSNEMIDRSVEPLVREIFNAVIVADEERFENALKAIPDERTKYAVGLAFEIDRIVMRDLHDDEPLSKERLDYLVSGFIEMNDWYDAQELPIENFFRVIAGMPADPIAADVAGLLSFLIGGWLLAAFLNPNTQWYEYLDDVLNRLDAEPVSSQ
jgi:hypothetical protein